MNNIIPDEFWDSEKGRYDSHRFFDTVSHSHISDYCGNKNCELTIVECRDGRWFIEDSWGADAKGAKDIYNPFEKGSYPTLFPTFDAANLRAVEVISSITGTPVEDLLLEEDED